MWTRRGQVSPGSHPRRSRKDVAVCMHGRIPKSQLNRQQWDAEAQGPEHEGAYLEQVTCLRELEGSDALGAREDRGK